jgi:hypothetical protein
MDILSSFSEIRQKLIEEQAFFQIENEQAKIIETDISNSQKTLIFQLRNIFSLHLSIILQPYATKNDYQNIESFERFNVKPNLNDQIQSIFKSISSNPSEFSSSIESFLLNNPDCEHHVIFSLIPALFSSFWSDEEYILFYEFFQHLHLFKSSFSRLILSHPSFYIFFSSFQEILHQKLLQQEDIDLSTLLILFQKHSFLFPSFFRKILLKDPDPLTFFKDDFLFHLLNSPSIYGLIQDSVSFSRLTKDIPSNNDFIQSIVDAL